MSAARGSADHSWTALNISRNELLDLVGRAEKMIAAPLASDNEPMRHLRRYVGLLQEPDGIGHDPALIAHVGRTLFDLIVLALDTQKDSLQLSRMRGLRAARAHEIIAAIKSNFEDSAFTPDRVALKVGLSRRYIQDLLRETGASFTERVLELRLLKARTMLTSHRNDGLKVSEIAEACGFNEISYFNQAFRRKFGAAPTQFRGGGAL